MGLKVLNKEEAEASIREVNKFLVNLPLNVRFNLRKLVTSIRADIRKEFDGQQDQIMTLQQELADANEKISHMLDLLRQIQQVSRWGDDAQGEIVAEIIRLTTNLHKLKGNSNADNKVEEN